MNEAFRHFKARGITKIAFGDLFLADIRQYRDERLAQAGMAGLYPIWLRDTDELVRTFIGLGFRAKLACVDTHAIDASFAGPIFKKTIACKAGETTMRSARFNYCDILSTEAA
jgi:diphthamide synthase (EF-2-diphthine--ammonia ligase)